MEDQPGDRRLSKTHTYAHTTHTYTHIHIYVNGEEPFIQAWANETTIFEMFILFYKKNYFQISLLRLICSFQNNTITETINPLAYAQSPQLTKIVREHCSKSIEERWHTVISETDSQRWTGKSWNRNVSLCWFLICSMLFLNRPQLFSFI